MPGAFEGPLGQVESLIVGVLRSTDHTRTDGCMWGSFRVVGVMHASDVPFLEGQWQGDRGNSDSIS